MQLQYGIVTAALYRSCSGALNPGVQTMRYSACDTAVNPGAQYREKWIEGLAAEDSLHPSQQATSNPGTPVGPTPGAAEASNGVVFPTDPFTNVKRAVVILEDPRNGYRTPYYPYDDRLAATEPTDSDDVLLQFNRIIELACAPCLAFLPSGLRAVKSLESKDLQDFAVADLSSIFHRDEAGPLFYKHLLARAGSPGYEQGRVVEKQGSTCGAEVVPTNRRRLQHDLTGSWNILPLGFIAKCSAILVVSDLPSSNLDQLPPILYLSLAHFLCLSSLPHHTSKFRTHLEWTGQLLAKMPVVNGVITVLPAPEGYIVDFDNPQRQAVPDAYYIAAFGTALSLLFLGQRLYVKLVLVGGLQIDDVFLLFSWATAFVTEALCIHMFASKSGGVHGWEISVETFNVYMMDVYLAAIIYIVCGSLAKIALLIFYFRLSPQRWFRWSIWGTIIFITGYTIGIFFPLIFACKPIAMNWDIRITDGECVNRPSLYIATAAANIISDIILLALPIPMVIKLQIPRMQKFGLLGIFAIGSLTVVTSIVRVSILPQMLSSKDPTWVISWASIWIIIESNLLVICAALPTLRKFFRHVAPKLIGEYGSRSGKSKTTEGASQPKGRTVVPSSQSRRDRHHYSQFDREEGQANDAFIMGPVTGEHDLVIMGGHGEEMRWGDSDSQKAIVATGAKTNIVQTKTVTVEYSEDHK
ncbi:hypothetical protein G7046_g6842 [Stylonectria norvegica]|nr:hypothetical protein G7046_g6842 [Stylonectria norvegica]